MPGRVHSNLRDGVCRGGKGIKARDTGNGCSIPEPGNAGDRRHGQPEGQGLGGAHCGAAARWCRSPHGASGAWHSLPAKPLRRPLRVVNTP